MVRRMWALGQRHTPLMGQSREWNVSDIKRYVTGVEKGELVQEKEVLSEGDRYNEMIITAFRTARGLNLERLSALPRIYGAHFEKEVKKYLNNKLVIQREQCVKLSKEGFLMSDAVMRDLMWVHDDEN